jgi:hypothetical protein
MVGEYSTRLCPKCGSQTDTITFDLEGSKSDLCQKCIDERIIFYAEEDTYVERIISTIITGCWGTHSLYKFIIKFGDVVLRNSNVAVGEVLETPVGLLLHRKEMITAETSATAKHMVIMRVGRIKNEIKKSTQINPRVSSMIERIEEP